MNILLHQQMDGSSANYLHLQTKRSATGNILAGITGNIAVTWDAAFADTNYTINVMIQSGSTSVFLVDCIVSMSTTGCVIAVKNISLLTSSGTLHVTAIHD